MAYRPATYLIDKVWRISSSGVKFFERVWETVLHPVNCIIKFAVIFVGYITIGGKPAKYSAQSALTNTIILCYVLLVPLVIKIIMSKWFERLLYIYFSILLLLE